MSYVPDNPLIAQSDHTLLLETGSPRFEEARDALLAFAELIKSPEYVHTWRITSLSLWNAAAAGHTADEVIAALRRFAKYPVPPRAGSGVVVLPCGAGKTIVGIGAMERLGSAR
jgi:DNA excision repair protein ERCC-3